MSALPVARELPPLVQQFLRWRVEAQDRSPRTVESDAADLKDFFRRAGISDPASVTVREIDCFATRMALDKLERDTRRRRLYTVKSFYDWMQSRGHVILERRVRRGSTTGGGGSRPIRSAQAAPPTSLELGCHWISSKYSCATGA